MKRLFFFGIVILVPSLIILGYFSLRGNSSQSFENPAAPTNESVLELPVRDDVDSKETGDQIIPNSVSSPREENRVVSTESSKESPAPVPAISASDLAVADRLMADGFRTTNGRSIDTIVLHSSYNAGSGDVYDIDKIVKQYEDYGVGAHYLIGRTGKIYRLIEEKNVAYHAGASKMPDGRKNVNEFSIGIEMVGTLESGYTEEQYRAVNALIADIKSRHKIKSIVGHADIAPDRKTDPWKFDWKKLNP